MCGGFGWLERRLGDGRLPEAFRGTLAAMIAKSSIIGLATAAILHWPCGATADWQHGGVLSPPVRPACISSPFGPRVLPNHPFAGTYHYGVDLPAPAGAPVLATAPGKVIRVQRKGPGGLEVPCSTMASWVFIAIWGCSPQRLPRVREPWLPARSLEWWEEPG